MDYSGKELGYSLKRPCDDCPFRKNAPMHNGIIRALPEMAKAYKKKWLVHSCHKTDPRADGYTGLVENKIQHCAGMMAMYKKEFDDVTYPAVLYGKVDPESYSVDTTGTFDNLSEMLSYYKGKLEERRVARFTTDDGTQVRVLYSPNSQIS